MKFFYGALLMFLVTSCQWQAFEDRLPPDSDPDCNEVTFEDFVKPIIDTNCAISGCHAGSQFPDLTVLENIQDHSADIRQRVITRNMPIGRTLTTNQINTIVCWIDNGALNN